MTAEKEKMTEFHFNEIRDELKRKYDPYMIERFLNIIYDEGLEAGESESISNFAEKIKEVINKSKMVYNKDLQGKKEYPVRVLDLDMLLLEIDKLVEEQSTGDKK